MPSIKQSHCIRQLSMCTCLGTWQTTGITAPHTWNHLDVLHFRDTQFSTQHYTLTSWRWIHGGIARLLMRGWKSRRRFVETRKRNRYLGSCAIESNLQSVPRQGDRMCYLCRNKKEWECRLCSRMCVVVWDVISIKSWKSTIMQNLVGFIIEDGVMVMVC